MDSKKVNGSGMAATTPRVASEVGWRKCSGPGSSWTSPCRAGANSGKRRRCAVMALGRCLRIFARGGWRDGRHQSYREITKTVTIPVMARCASDIFRKLEVFAGAGSGLHRDPERSAHDSGLKRYQVWKHEFRVPFVCGARNRARRCGHRGRRSDDSTKGEDVPAMLSKRAAYAHIVSRCGSFPQARWTN